MLIVQATDENSVHARGESWRGGGARDGRYGVIGHVLSLHVAVLSLSLSMPKLLRLRGNFNIIARRKEEGLGARRY